MSNKKVDFLTCEYKRDLNRAIIIGVCFLIASFTAFFIGFEIKNAVGFCVSVCSLFVLLSTIILFVFSVRYMNNKRKRLREYIESFSFSADNITRAAILSYPDPIVIADQDGVIKWYNPAFTDMCGRENLFGNKIQDIFPSIRLANFFEEKFVRRNFNYGGRDFVLTGEVSTGSVDEASEPMLGLIFADVSEISMLNKKLEEKRSVVCTAVIDNYDEVFKETPATNHGALIGDIERCINDWVEKGNGFYRRYERDRFIILFEAASFEILKDEKFTVLDNVKEINQQNKIPVTLSIGVGAVDDDMKENDRLSVQALDMALGRGGDQAVMKTDDGLVFFGAKSLGVEKTTKVKARVVAKSLCRLSDESSDVIIMGHKGADFDCLGAAVGLFRAICDRGGNAYIALDRTKNNADPILSDLLILPEYSDRIISSERAMVLTDANTLLIIVDTHRPSIVEYPELLKKAKKIALIDHHRRSEEFIDNAELTYHEPYASSTCEMVTEILQYMNNVSNLSVQEAEALYCGIYLDTKGFTFKTGARTFEAAAYLRKMGVDPIGVHKLFRNDLSMYIQKSKIISGAKIYRENIAIALCEDYSKNNVQLVVAQAADELLNINGVEASFVLAGVANRVIISGRSLGAVNVQVILEKLGGGGHITIAGAQLENSSLTIAELKLQNAIDDILYD